jgi:cobalamin biosynthesis Mg chelatase CobN
LFSWGENVVGGLGIPESQIGMTSDPTIVETLADKNVIDLKSRGSIVFATVKDTNSPTSTSTMIPTSTTSSSSPTGTASSISPTSTSTIPTSTTSSNSPTSTSTMIPTGTTSSSSPTCENKKRRNCVSSPTKEQETTSKPSEAGGQEQAGDNNAKEASSANLLLSLSFLSIIALLLFML